MHAELSLAAPTAKQHKSANAVDDHIAAVASLSDSLLSDLDSALETISEINLMTHLISMNARVEAARAGELGRGFAVVADEMARLSREVSGVTKQLGARSRETGISMRAVVDSYVTDVRNARLCDLALANIDLIDRNLYERSCDVRWWATDAAAVQCAQLPEMKERAYATRRLGQILDSYTVYYDLVLVDLQGTIIANGRPNRFRSVGMNVQDSAWFRAALATHDGTQYGFEFTPDNPLVDQQPALLYSCAVREEGKVAGMPVGVLGIIFDWTSLAQTIVQRTPLTPSEWEKTRACIVRDDGYILADSAKHAGQALSFPGMNKLLGQARSAIITDVSGRQCCVAHAASPGYETYRTGWHSLIIQRL